MNNFVDEVLASAPRYNIKDNDGNMLFSNVQTELATRVQTQGTPLNKAFFDSIKNDLNSRLLINNKASTAEAVAGVNNTKYMTPLRTKEVLNSLKTIKNISTGTTSETLYTFNNNSTSIIKIEGLIGSPVYYNNLRTSITLNGTQIRYGADDSGHYNVDSSHVVNVGEVTSIDTYSPFWYEFNMATKTWKAYVYEYSRSGGFIYIEPHEYHGMFTSLTNLVVSKPSQVPLKVTITEIV